MKFDLSLSSSVWKDPPENQLPAGLVSILDEPELVLRILQRQGMKTAAQAQAFMDFRTYSPSSPYTLDDMEKGIERTTQAIKAGELVGVWGDFDVDGQTATATMVSTLRRVGAKVVYHIPVRGPESHGIKLDVLQIFIQQSVSLLITCDTGISEVDQVSWAQSHGVDVIITDHHTLPDKLPQAFAVINPQRLNPDHPLRPLPGVGVACKFAEALFERFNLTEESRGLHDLAALGIIADIAELHSDARYLAQSGIDLIRQAIRPSIVAMLKTAEIEPSQFSEESISFALAPRLNAIGRLSDANPMVEFLLSNDPAVISVTVNQLEGLNARRKLLCDQVFQGALAQIEFNPALLDHPVLILSHPEWPAGVVGIVASRLVSLYHRPVILLVSPPNRSMRGSARSVEGINITAAIRENAALLTSFGGHPMAAGLSLEPDNFKPFQRGLEQAVNQQCLVQPIINELQIDVWQKPGEIDHELLRSMDRLAPFGAGNPPIVMAARNMRLVNSTPIGKTHEHLQLIVEDTQGLPSKFLWWQAAGLPQPDGIFDLAYTARLSTYKGQPQIQLEWLDFRPIETETLNLREKQKKVITHFDYRKSLAGSAFLNEIMNKFQPEFFREGIEFSPIPGNCRFDLEPNDTLVMVTIPPSRDVLEQTLHLAKPERIFWFGTEPAVNEIETILKTTAQLIRHGFSQKQSLFNVQEIAAKLSTTIEIIDLVIKWLSARGDVTVLEETDHSIQLIPGGTADKVLLKEFKQKIQKAVAETQAFRRYALRCDLNELVQNI